MFKLSCVISITFENFTTESCCDFVYMYDGATASASRITYLSGSNAMQRGRRFSSTQQYMFVNFLSDVSVTASGFTATFQSIAYPYCESSTFPAEFNGNGIIYSPFYPEDYPDKADCHWRLIATSGHVIKLTFVSFSTENAFDFVHIYDGSSNGYKLIATLSGLNATTDIYWSRQRYMYIQFVSDSTNAYQGFNATFESIAATTTVPPSTTTGIVDERCPPAWQPLHLQTTGSVKSMNYPAKYSNDMDCHWRLITTDGFVPRIRLSAFTTERYYDYLRIYDGWNMSSTLMASLNGNINNIQTSYYALQRYMYIRFTTDESVNTTGFSLTFESINLEYCPPSSQPRELYGSGTLSSFNYPSGYYDNMDCHWLLRAYYPQVVKLTFNYFLTESADYVTLYDGRSNYYNTIAVLSGSAYISASYYSTGEYMYIRFVTDNTVTSTGFTATFSSANYPDNSSLEAWEIALIVIGSVAAFVIVVVAVCLIHRHCNKKKKCAAKTTTEPDYPSAGGPQVVFNQATANVYQTTTDVKSNVADDVNGSAAACVVCMDRPSDKVVLVPCGHTRFCSDCIQKMMNSGGSCPTCHQRIQIVLPLYV